jgi:hypothetical protein
MEERRDCCVKGNCVRVCVREEEQKKQNTFENILCGQSYWQRKGERTLCMQTQRGTGII